VISRQTFFADANTNNKMMLVRMLHQSLFPTLFLSSQRLQQVSMNAIHSASSHDEALVRPQTSNVPTTTPAQPDLVFFNTFFCPYAQMAWIALNEKGMADKTEFVEGLTIRGGDYEVHPRLRALHRSGVPTLYHPATETVVDGSTHCVEFIDKHFGKPHQLLPKDEDLLARAKRCETLLHSTFTFPFYSMLLRQEPEEQEKAKQKITKAIEQLVCDYQGPFFLGDQFTVADIAVAPYFDRMVVLEHYRDYRVPNDGDTAKWHEWSKNVLSRPSVAATRQDRERIIEAYKRYAKCYVRNNWYQRVFELGY
jgi:glutathione S-transferase